MQMTREDFAFAYEEGRPRTVRFLRSRGAESDRAADIAQAAWMRGWERMGQLRDAAKLVTWINTIALNFYRRSLRSERSHVTLEEPLYSNSVLNWAAIDLYRILEGCRVSDRAILEAQLNGWTAKEIAEETGVSETAIRIRMYRARKAAREVAERTAEGSFGAASACAA